MFSSDLFSIPRIAKQEKYQNVDEYFQRWNLEEPETPVDFFIRNTQSQNEIPQGDLVCNSNALLKKLKANLGSQNQPSSLLSSWVNAGRMNRHLMLVKSLKTMVSVRSYNDKVWLSSIFSIYGSWYGTNIDQRAVLRPPTLYQSLPKDLEKYDHGQVTWKELIKPGFREAEIKKIFFLHGKIAVGTMDPKVSDGNIVSDTDRDILKIAVINRYKDSSPSVALVKNFGFKKGAIASSVAHDSHNIIAVGVSDGDLTRAVNLVIKNKGGLSVVHDDFEMSLPLPVAGLMTDIGAYKVAESYTNIEEEAKSLGSNLDDPFMTLSFMALLVIPDIKISDKGLFDVNKFEFIGIDEE
jgi:hypothetical protein